MKTIITNDSVCIKDSNGEEIVYWHEDQWKEDPETVVPTIANAIKLCYENPDKLKKLVHK